MSKISLIVLFLLMSLPISILKGQELNSKLKEANNLKEVRKIYIDKMGSSLKNASDFVESSCKLYVEEQNRTNCNMTQAELKTQRSVFFAELSYIFQDFGFQIVSDFEEADAVMMLKVSVQKRCGGLTYSSHWKGRPPGFYIESIGATLNSFAGKKLWAGTSGGRTSFRESSISIAEKLRKSKYTPLKVKK